MLNLTVKLLPNAFLAFISNQCLIVAVLEAVSESLESIELNSEKVRSLEVDILNLENFQESQNILIQVKACLYIVEPNLLISVRASHTQTLQLGIAFRDTTNEPVNKNAVAIALSDFFKESVRRLHVSLQALDSAKE